MYSNSLQNKIKASWTNYTILSLQYLMEPVIVPGGYPDLSGSTTKKNIFFMCVFKVAPSQTFEVILFKLKLKYDSLRFFVVEIIVFACSPQN